MSRKRRKGPSPDGSGTQGGRRQEVEITCPGCQSHLLVDAATGAIIRQQRKKQPSRSFEDVLSAEKARRTHTDSLFGKALKSQKDQQVVLERKFEEAIKKAADEPDEKTPRPLDRD